MKALGHVLLAAGLSGLLWSGTAKADVLRLGYDDTQADPAETFEVDCLGDTPAEDCDARAALIEGELVTLLSRLESDEDPETLALFQAALELDSPLVQAMAARYLSRTDQQPAGFFSTVKTFFLGPDAPLGAASSAVLATSSDETDQRLAELFDEQRPSSDYEGEPVRDTDDFSQDRLVSACVRDARLDLERSFSDDERYAPAERLLVYDRFVQPLFDPTGSYPVTAFATDADLDEVSAFFSERFGPPLGPVAGSQQRLAELTSQLIALQNAAAGGDQQAIVRLQAVAAEIEQVQQTTSLDVYLQLTAVHADSDLVWVDGDVTESVDRPVRAVTAGEDPLLGKTVIRYFNATTNQPAGSGGAGDGSSDGQAGATSGPGEEPADGGDASSPNQGPGGADSGCGCAIPGPARGGGSLASLGLLGWALLRSRRRRERRAI